MKKPLGDILRIVLFFTVWRWVIVAIEFVADRIWLLQTKYQGVTPWANFDGVHYASIASQGYGLYQHAFFPFYPWLIRIASTHFTISVEKAGMLVSHVASFFAIILFYKLFSEINRNTAARAVVFLLLFPTSYYLASVYSEGLFFLLSVATFYAATRKRWFIAGICGGLASVTRFYGVFLLPAILIEYAHVVKKKTVRDLLAIFLIPTGIVYYMAFLDRTIGDAFAFVHTLPAFGTGRETRLILLPQVLWRYVKIFITVSPSDYVYSIALFEFFILFLFLTLLVKAYVMRMRVSYIFYSAVIILIPTLTGTLTSLPRYVLSAFPLFFVLASIDNTYVRYFIALVFGAGLVVFTSAFLRGQFVA